MGDTPNKVGDVLTTAEGGYPHTGNGVLSHNLNAQFVEGSNVVFFKPIASACVTAVLSEQRVVRELLK